MTSTNWGASPEDWETLSVVLGLTEDLLPVVSNPQAVISPASKMKGIGKTPSCYNGNGQVIGISAWTKKKATPEEIEAWAEQSDYGICIQSRTVRALDIDVTDAELAAKIAEVILAHLGSLPERFRSNSTKSLFALRLPGDFTKRVIKTEHGIIEFLATGQQFVSHGTHPSGVRYEWSDGGPFSIPEISTEKFENLWLELEAKFAVESAITSTASVKSEKLAATSANDPVAVFLHEHNHVLDEDRATGRLDIVCPFADEHSGEGAPSATSYFPAMTGGYALGHFDCKHAHCEHRTDEEFKDKLGIAPTGLNDFENLAQNERSVEENEDEPEAEASTSEAKVAAKAMFTAIPAGEFSQRPSPGWIVKGVLPVAEIVVIFGAPGSGKSFAALDITAAIASASSWREQKVKGGEVVYVAAEGAGGFRNRLVAYSEVTVTNFKDFRFAVVGAAPNLMDKAQALEIAKAVLTRGRVSVVVVDTFAQIMPGGNENSGEDVGKVLAHCHGIHRATGAVVILVHHSGKDDTKGARGHSSLKGNADTELEVYRVNNERVLSISKQKDGEDGKEYGFRLQQVCIGDDKDGDAITSCVVVESESIPQKQKPRKGASVPPAEGGGGELSSSDARSL
jgi:hypothetical protein